MKIEISFEEAFMLEAFKKMRRFAKSDASKAVKEQCISTVFEQALEVLDGED